MTTLSDLPASDPSIARVLGHLWIGDVKITLDTVLNPTMIQSKIKMLETAYICNSCEAASVAETIEDLKKILSYLNKCLHKKS
jgi:hypothetical protein